MGLRAKILVVDETTSQIDHTVQLRSAEHKFLLRRHLNRATKFKTFFFIIPIVSFEGVAIFYFLDISFKIRY